MKNLIGWLSVCLILIAYALLVFGFVQSTDKQYNFLNLLGGIGLCWRVYQDKNWSNFALEIVFITIAVIALIK